MVKKYRIFWLFITSFSGQAIHAQDSTFLARMASALDAQPAQERVYLHLNKPNYGFSDTIWYKAYTVIGQKHQLSALSGVLYVELFNLKDSLVTRQIIPLVSGIGWSDIPLPFNLKPDSYRLLAYTRWMRNFGTDAFDEQRIVIGGVAPVVAKTAEKCDVQFFPEGGELMDGVRCRVAVKAVGANGFGQDIKGTIEDNTGNIVADFTTQHLGMGVFAILPQAGKSYKAKVNIPGETSFTVDLPKAQEEGCTIAVNNNDKDSLLIKIATNEQALTKNKGQTFYIIAQSNGKIYYTTQGKLENTAYTARIAKSRLPEGIMQVTLFNQNGEPLAERIAFIDKKEDELNLNISTVKPIYNTRDKVQISLMAKDISQKPITGSFSISIINESKVLPDQNTESTILNNLLLTSELKGYIERPDYYFNNQNEKATADLDLLMLTQGYRRYKWKQIFATATNTTNPTYLPERTQELQGTITAPGGKPMQNSKITLAATKRNIFRDTTADENGKFTFTGLNITDTTTVVIRARKANDGDNVKITPVLPEYPKIIPAAYNNFLIIPDSAKAKRQYNDYQKEQKDYQFKNGKMLNTVTIKAHKEKPKPDMSYSSNLHGGGNADQVIMGDDLGSGISLSQCLSGKAFGVTFYSDKAFNIRTMAPMGVIIDGEILSNEHLNDIPVEDIYSVEVLRSTFARSIYGSALPAGGALLITTRRGPSAKYITNIIPAGLITYPFLGYYKAKAFYVPKYDHAKTDEQMADLRTTVYWNPNILTDKDGKATMEFYNNDSKGTYRVVVEGIDDDGRLGRAVYRYEVK